MSAAKSLLILHDILALRYYFVTLGQDQFDVAWVAHVRVDTTVSTVCSATLLGCLVDLDVLDKEVTSIETFCVGIGFGVLEESKEEFGRFDWESSTRDTELLSCFRKSC